MGYVHKKKTFLLKFADGEMEGLEVKVQAIPLGKLLEFEELAAKPGREGWREMLTTLTGAIQSWNVEEEDGTPVAADVDGLLAQETDLVLAIIQAWQGGMTTVPAPLPEGSGSSEISLASQIPMTPVDSGSSQSLAS